MRNMLVVLALVFASTAQAATVTEFVRVGAGQTMTVTNPHAAPLAGTVAPLVWSGRAAQAATSFSLMAGETRTFGPFTPSHPTMAAAEIVVVNTDNSVRTSPSGQTIAYANRPVSLIVSRLEDAVLYGMLNAQVRVSFYAGSDTTSPYDVNVFGSGNEVSAVPFTVSQLLTPGRQFVPGTVKVEPLSGQAVVAQMRISSRRRAVRSGASPAPLVISVQGSAGCAGQGTIIVSISHVDGSTYVWTLFNATPQGANTSSQLTVAPVTEGFATAGVAVTRNGLTSYDEVNLVVGGRPSLSSLNATSATQGQTVTISGNADTNTVELYGTDFPSNGTSVQVSNGQYRHQYTASVVGSKSVRVVGSNACGSSDQTDSYSVYPSCSTPSSSITAPSSTTEGSTFTASMPSGAASYSWSVTGGSIQSGQTSRTVTIVAGATGTLRIFGTASNGGGCESSSSVNVTVTVPAPVINSFTADSYTVGFGGNTTLRFSISNAASWKLLSTKGNGRTPSNGTGSGNFTSIYTRAIAMGTDVITLEVTGTDGSKVTAQLTIN